eukprot:scaffold5338_cov112-Cylindrotheca_fusiformis.AAC.2
MTEKQFAHFVEETLLCDSNYDIRGHGSINSLLLRFGMLSMMTQVQNAQGGLQKMHELIMEYVTETGESQKENWHTTI